MTSVFRKLFLCFLISSFLFSCNEQNDLESKELKSNLIDSSIDKANEKSKLKEQQLKDLNAAYAIIISLDETSLKVKKLQKISIEYYKRKDFDKFLQLNRKSLSISKEISDSIGMAKSYGNVGIYYRNRQLDSAYANFYKADKIYRYLDQGNNIPLIEYAFDHGRTLIDLAKLSRKVKDYSESEALTVSAIQKFESSGNLEYVPLSYNNLGLIARYMERYNDAIVYHEKAIEYAKTIGKEKLYAVIGNNNIGTVYEAQKEYQKAEQYYLKALSFDDFFLDKQERYARLLHNLAYARFLANKDDPSVLELFDKSSRISDSLNDQIGLSTSNLHYSEYYQFKKNDSLAKIFALKVKEAAPVVHNNVELLKSYQLLSEVSKSNEALKYAQKHIMLNDSLIKEERAYTNKFARIKFESDKKTEEIAAISRENQYLIFAILGLSVLFLLGYVIFRQQQSNKELLFEQKQQQSNQEIYRLLLSQQLKLEEGRKMEQHRMSEELHDGVLGRLFGVRLSLDGINQRAN
ncbi:tetratricopeptide repeat protein, partial [Aquimarina litoralis]|uniref:tetratricopeptide repeat protein n=1 Tax=Aquimarina litoralis TaxID=584605 RepID=UPI001C55FEB0